MEYRIEASTPSISLSFSLCCGHWIFLVGCWIFDQTKNPTPGDGEWGWKDGWFSEARLLATTEDERESAKAEKGGGGGFWDGGRIQRDVVDTYLRSVRGGTDEHKSDFLTDFKAAARGERDAAVCNVGGGYAGNCKEISGCQHRASVRSLDLRRDRSTGSWVNLVTTLELVEAERVIRVVSEVDTEVGRQRGGVDYTKGSANFTHTQMGGIGGSVQLVDAPPSEKSAGPTRGSVKSRRTVSNAAGFEVFRVNHSCLSRSGEGEGSHRGSEGHG